MLYFGQFCGLTTYTCIFQSNHKRFVNVSNYRSKWLTDITKLFVKFDIAGQNC